MHTLVSIGFWRLACTPEMTLSGRLVWSLCPQRSMKSDWRQSLPSSWRLHSCKRCQGSSCAPTLQVMTQRWWLGKISETSVGTRRYARYSLPRRWTPLCVDWRYFIFQKLISLQPWGGWRGRGEQGECNDKLENKPQQLAVLWRPLAKLKTLLTSL